MLSWQLTDLQLLLECLRSLMQWICQPAIKLELGVELSTLLYEPILTGSPRRVVTGASRCSRKSSCSRVADLQMSCHSRTFVSVLLSQVLRTASATLDMQQGASMSLVPTRLTFDRHAVKHGSHHV